MELSMVERKTPTATTRKTAHRFCFGKEDTTGMTHLRATERQKKTSSENQSSF